MPKQRCNLCRGTGKDLMNPLLDCGFCSGQGMIETEGESKDDSGDTGDPAEQEQT